ncbi:hypothetical protein [Allorhodopirellula solitaria]|uniref:Uncharacterized protein n=1 Tax=Allorhodopirellula solitaria TaxID=2527987 RepID=A0A5C5WYH0_9BACT|nr:hypothetical protein [Allorhodopirellula solitaria]TWT55737.1 hypothetical protein CA85_48370 [Allorhodopirellula solitaria]
MQDSSSAPSGSHPLDVMAITPAVSAAALSEKESTATPAPAPNEIDTPSGQVDTVGLETRLHAHLNSLGMSVQGVEVTSSDDRVDVRVVIPAGIPSMPIRDAIDVWLVESYPNLDAFLVEIESDEEL